MLRENRQDRAGLGPQASEPCPSRGSHAVRVHRLPQVLRDHPCQQVFEHLDLAVHLDQARHRLHDLLHEGRRVTLERRHGNLHQRQALLGIECRGGLEQVPYAGFAVATHVPLHCQQLLFPDAGLLVQQGVEQYFGRPVGRLRGVLDWFGDGGGDGGSQ